MGKVQLYIAQSLDGYIADTDGGVAWLEAFNAGGQDYGYAEFMKDVGAVVMGATTYEQLIRWGWSYGDAPTWVFTHRELPSAGDAPVHFTDDAVPNVISEIRSHVDNNIWVMGGGEIVKQFLDEQMFDEMRVFVTPTILGDGIPLWVNGTAPRNLELTYTKAWDEGLVELHYRFKDQA